MLYYPAGTHLKAVITDNYKINNQFEHTEIKGEYNDLYLMHLHLVYQHTKELRHCRLYSKPHT